MIVLTVVSFNGAPTAGPSARFDELGGTIGRADNNQLVLPDPERTVSRVHARVLYRNGGYVVVDSGSNPITVNGFAVGSGSEQAIKPGDQLQIGGYVLAVTAEDEAVADDPFADLFGDGLAAAPTPIPAPSSAPRTPSAPPPLSSSTPPPPAQKPAVMGIPEDWDPFAPDPSPAGGAGSAPAIDGPFDPMVDVAPSEHSLDDLFGLGTGTAPGDPLGAAMPASPTGAARVDLLEGFGRPPSAAPATRGDLGSELNTPMPLVPPRPESPPPPGGAARAVPAGAVFSWEETDAPVGPGSAADPLGIVEPPRSGHPAAVPAADVPAAVPRVAAPVATPVAPAIAGAASGSSGSAAVPAGRDAVGADALLQALIEGLGVPDLRLDKLEAEKMRLIGRLLHEATRGAVELLVARAALKRELRADVTMIVARENNPLKFSPTVEVALQHLLGPPMPGFMAAAPAMRDAFDDLRAHQLGVMAGMRAALEGVLQRFDPAQLEANLAKRSSIGNLIPSSRKARLWELFQALFNQLQTEAQDDFDELFGKAFLRAYESQLARLRDEPGPG